MLESASRGGSSIRGGSPSGGSPSGGVPPWGGSPSRGGYGIPACTEADTLPPCGQTHTCKNITLATTSLRPVINEEEHKTSLVYSSLYATLLLELFCFSLPKQYKMITLTTLCISGKTCLAGKIVSSGERYVTQK